MVPRSSFSTPIPPSTSTLPARPCARCSVPSREKTDTHHADGLPLLWSILGSLLSITLMCQTLFSLQTFVPAVPCAWSLFSLLCAQLAPFPSHLCSQGSWFQPFATSTVPPSSFSRGLTLFPLLTPHHHLCLHWFACSSPLPLLVLSPTSGRDSVVVFTTVSAWPLCSKYTWWLNEWISLLSSGQKSH